MKSILKLPGRIKLFFALMVALILLGILGKPLPAASGKGLYLESDSRLYELYVTYRQRDPLFAVMYLWAYIKRDPPAYVNNTNGFRDWANKETTSLVNYIYTPQRQMTTVNAHLKSCGCYPCDQCEKKHSEYGVSQQGLSGSALGGSPLAPPDAVIVCTERYYQGQCRVLPVGAYYNDSQIGLPNDSISSVLVGSQVNLTLYVHANLTSPSIFFAASDGDLSDNYIDSTYRWNDNASSIVVEPK